MKRKLLSIALLLSGISYAQTGIGTDVPHSSAILHVSAPDKGVLLPEVKLGSLTDVEVIKDPKEGLIIYNLTTDSDKNLSVGFYYWGVNTKDDNKNQWIKIVDDKDVPDPGAISNLALVEDPKENVDEVKAGFVFNNGVTNSADVKFSETLTKITKDEYSIYVYKVDDPLTGELIEEHTDVPREGEIAFNNYQAYKFVYENEKGDIIEIKGSDLFSPKDGNQGGASMETLTSLRLEKDFNGLGKSLVYKDERKQENYVKISDLFDQTEKITTLEMDVDKNSLVYTNETGMPNAIFLDQIVKEPWYVATTKKQATKNEEDIYTQGWVGIGYDEKSDSSKVPNEKLRVNGSITATNSYYADYVFDSYFEGYSNLKYDYKFKDLNTVDNFIKTYRHLPGITPITDLSKSETGYTFNVSELSIQLLEKTEELFLHVIEQQKEINAKERRVEKLESEVDEMAKRLEALEALLIK